MMLQEKKRGEFEQIKYAMEILSEHRREVMLVFIGQLVANQEAENSMELVLLQA